MLKFGLALFGICLLFSCKTLPAESTIDYPRHVGDITFDDKVDDPEFTVCNDSVVFQYYEIPGGFRYRGEKITLIQKFEKGLEGKKFSAQSGFITIRFIVNCQGKTGRFRIQQLDPTLKPTTFESNIVDTLLALTKELDGWVIANNGKKSFDYYQYLTFKIENGVVKEILP